MIRVVVHSVLNHCLDKKEEVMASEGDPYDQFSNFNYRKILLEIIEGDNNIEISSSNNVDRQQLIKNFFQ
jgi:hypothetical protein